MNGEAIGAFIEQVCRRASEAGLKLRVDQTDDGYSWEWSNGLAGSATIHEKPMALYFACEDLAGINHGHVVNISFNQ